MTDKRAIVDIGVFRYTRHDGRRTWWQDSKAYDLVTLEYGVRSNEAPANPNLPIDDKTAEQIMQSCHRRWSANGTLVYIVWKCPHCGKRQASTYMPFYELTTCKHCEGFVEWSTIAQSLLRYIEASNVYAARDADDCEGDKKAIAEAFKEG